MPLPTSPSGPLVPTGRDCSDHRMGRTMSLNIRAFVSMGRKGAAVSRAPSALLALFNAYVISLYVKI